MSNEEYVTIKTKIATQLTNLKWDKADELAFDYTTGLAHKSYTTAVGSKDVTAYLRRSEDDDKDFILTAEYESEGRNVCSTISCHFHLDLTISWIEVYLSYFVKFVDEAIAASYARKLFLNGVKNG